MKRIILVISIQLSVVSLICAQTLHVEVGSVHYLFPAEQAGKMVYDNGTSLTVLNKTFALSDVTAMYVDEEKVTDSSVQVAYSTDNVIVTVAGNVAQFLTVTQNGAHVKIEQSSDVDKEITYTLSGSSADGGFYMSGAYKATVEFSNLTLTNVSAAYSGAAVHIQNSKRIKVKPLNGTTNTLVDATSNSKGCLYIKGHAEFAQKGTLNITGNTKHGIKVGEYMTIKNSTINVLSAVGDGINCEQFFLIESGKINIDNVGDDGLQCSVEDTEAGRTDATADHEDEDSGNVYIGGGTITMNVAADAAKGIKAEGDILISGGTINVTNSGKGMWDTTDLETKASSCINGDRDILISGGTINLTATGSGGKGLKCDSLLTIDGGVITIATTGGLYYNTGSSENLNANINTDDVDSKYYSSPKGIRAGTKTWISGSGKNAKYTYAGGLVINGGKIYVTTEGRNGEGVESKNYMNINGGEICVKTYDDGINAAQDLTINDGYIYALATNNDGIDANGNVYIKGGLVFAGGASNPEVAIDANTEGGKKLYITGGTIIAVGNLEGGAQISGGTCKYTTSWTAETRYALYNGSELAVAFVAPNKPSGGGGPGGGGPWGGGGGSNSVKLVVYTSSTPALYSNVTVSDGTELFDGQANIGGIVSGGSSVSLTNYSTGGGGGPGGGGW